MSKFLNSINIKGGSKEMLKKLVGKIFLYRRLKNER